MGIIITKIELRRTYQKSRLAKGSKNYSADNRHHPTKRKSGDRNKDSDNRMRNNDTDNRIRKKDTDKQMRNKYTDKQMDWKETGQTNTTAVSLRM